MLVRYCMKLASFRAGFRAVKPFTGAAICTSCVAITRSCPGVLRCFKSTHPQTHHHAAAARQLSTGLLSSTTFRNAKTEDNMDNHLTNAMNKYLALDAEEDFSESLSLEEITSIQKRRLKATKKARGAREFFSKDPEKRKLSWDTIEQIRYLRQENPSEWTTSVLAQSFSVSEEVIAKVLKSKFSPSSKVRQKQDLAVAEKFGNGVIKVRSKALVESGQGNQEAQEQNHPHDFQRTKAQASQTFDQIVKGPSNVYSLNDQRTGMQHKQTMTEKNYQSQVQSSLGSKDLMQDEVGHDDEQDFTFGKFDFENVDNLMDQVKMTPRVVRRGRNFYNESGEFLYRV